MKALIVIRNSDWGWLQRFFPGTHPALFAIANKPLLEYQIDFALFHGCREIRVMGDGNLEQVERHFGNGERWGAAVSYGHLSAGDGIAELLQKNQRFCADSQLLIIAGMMFIHYDKNQSYSAPLMAANAGMMTDCEAGFVLYLGTNHRIAGLSRAEAEQDFALTPLTSLVELFDLSLQVVDSEQNHYVLPGYGGDRDVLLGQNVEIGKDVEIVPPVIIGDNVRLLGHAKIGPKAIIGSEVIVDDGAEVSEAVVLGGSYLGRNLSFRRWFVVGSSIISPQDEIILNIRERFLLAALNGRSRKPLRYLSNVLLALLLGMIQVVPFVILTLVFAIGGRLQYRHGQFLTADGNEIMSLPTIEVVPDGLWGRLYLQLALERFPLLLHVLRGRLVLVGNRLLPEGAANRQFLADFADYLPGVFAYGEAERVARGSAEEEVCERFYAANKSLVKDISMMLNILLAGR